MSSIGRRLPVAALIACLLSATAVADEDQPTATANHVRFAEWLDADVGLCLEVENLGEEWARFSESRFYQGVVEFPPAAEWLSQHRQGLSLLAGEIERRTGVTPRELATKLLGRQLLFAIWPPSNPQTDKPRALLLAESTDGQLMRRLLERLVAARRLAGRWRGRRTVVAGDSTFSIDVVVPDEEQSEFFITAVGDVAIFANDEALLGEILRRRAAVEPTSLASSPAYLAAAHRLTGGVAAKLFINPRAWDAALEADLKRKPPGSEEAKSQAVIVAAWRAIEYVSGGLQLAPQTAVELAWQWRPDALPEPVREVAASLAGSCQFVDRLPDDALIAFAGHADIRRLIRYGIEHNGPDDRDPRSQFDSILFWALAAGVGPDWGGFLKAASDRPPSRSVDLVVGLQTRPLEAGPQEKPLAETLEPVLHALLSSAVEAVNRQSKVALASIRSTDHDGSRITTVLGLLPDRPEQELAYCVDRLGRLWFGTSAAAIEQASRSSATRTHAGHPLGDPSGLMRVNLAEWRKLAARGPSAVEFLWEGKQLDARSQEREYQTLLAFCRLADRLVVATRVDESSVHVSCTLEANGQGADPK
ncbi:MAG TPA: hypothetical protein VG826_14720 [Pirellulales bacterium]|nr:hypothetical protein [Pirellulales bacterium]